MSTTKPFTKLEVEAALCVWEWCLEQRDGSLRGWFEGEGSASVRQRAMVAGRVWHDVA